MAGYPVYFDVEPQTADRNRLTTAFRLILAIPQVLIVGSPGSVGLGANSGTGVFGAVASVCAFLAWFAILFTGRYPEGLYAYGVGVQRWTLRVQAYLLLMRDEYPPFSLE